MGGTGRAPRGVPSFGPRALSPGAVHLLSQAPSAARGGAGARTSSPRCQSTAWGSHSLPHPTSHCAQRTAGAPGLLSGSQRSGRGTPTLRAPRPLSGLREGTCSHALPRCLGVRRDLPPFSALSSLSLSGGSEGGVLPPPFSGLGAPPSSSQRSGRGLPTLLSTVAGSRGISLRGAEKLWDPRSPLNREQPQICNGGMRWL